ncbi:MAG: sodium:solute symporter family protein [Candidatus Bathyarchaeia archaeon]
MISPAHMYLGVALYFAAMLAVAHYGRRRTGVGIEEYYLAGRRIGGFVAALTYSATTYSAFMMVGLVGYVWAGGIGAMGFELTYLIGTGILLLIFAPRISLAGRIWGIVSPSELLAKRYGSAAVGALASLICLLFLIPYTSVQAQGSAYLLNRLTGGGISYEAGLAFMMTIIAVLAWWGGMRGVAWSDAIQALVMIITATALLAFLFQSAFGGLGAFASKIEAEAPELLSVPGPNAFFNFPRFLGLTIPWFFFAITNPQVSQRLLVPRSMYSLKWMLRGFLIFGLLYTVICTLFGLSSRLIYPSLPSPDLAMPKLLSEKVPPPLSIVTLIGILSAAVTTADSILLSLGSMVGRDIYRAIRPGATEAGELRVGKAVIVLMALALLAFSWSPQGLIVELSVLSSAGLLALVPPFVGAFFWRRGTALGAVVGMAAGALTAGSLHFLRAYPLGQWPGVWALPASAMAFLIASALSKPPDGVEEFFGTLKEALASKNVAL